MIRIRAAIVAFAGIALAACAAPSPLSEADRAAVDAALESYRQAWLAGDAESVLSHVSDSITLYVPGRGAPGKIGKAAVRAHWFPPADTTYPITRYEIVGQQVHGGGDIAVVEGRSTLAWDTRVGNTILGSSASESEFITVMRREGGRWVLFRQMYVVR